MFCVVFWAALGRPPLSGTKILAGLGFTFVVLVNLSVGALASGGTVLRRLTHSPASDSFPLISGDRKTVVYVHSASPTTAQLRVVAADGIGDRPLFLDSRHEP